MIHYIDIFAKKAVMYDVLEVILIILLIYFAIKIFFRLFGRSIMRYIMKKVGQKVEKKFREQQGFGPENRKEGETIIEKKPFRRKKPNKETGEYIDYEEID